MDTAATAAPSATCVCGADVCTKDTLVDKSAPGGACAVGGDGALDHSIEARSPGCCRRGSHCTVLAGSAPASAAPSAAV